MQCRIEICSNHSNKYLGHAGPEHWQITVLSWFLSSAEPGFCTMGLGQFKDYTSSPLYKMTDKVLLTQFLSYGRRKWGIHIRNLVNYYSPTIFASRFYAARHLRSLIAIFLLMLHSCQMFGWSLLLWVHCPRCKCKCDFRKN